MVIYNCTVVYTLPSGKDLDEVGEFMVRSLAHWVADNHAILSLTICTEE